MPSIVSVPDATQIPFECVVCTEGWGEDCLPIQLPCDCAEALVCGPCLAGVRYKCPMCAQQFTQAQTKTFHKSFLNMLKASKPFCESCGKYLSGNETAQTHVCLSPDQVKAKEDADKKKIEDLEAEITAAQQTSRRLADEKRDLENQNLNDKMEILQANQEREIESQMRQERLSQELELVKFNLQLSQADARRREQESQAKQEERSKRREEYVKKFRELQDKNKKNTRNHDADSNNHIIIVDEDKYFDEHPAEVFYERKSTKRSTNAPAKRKFTTVEDLFGVSDLIMDSPLSSADPDHEGIGTSRVESFVEGTKTIASFLTSAGKDAFGKLVLGNQK